MRKHAFLVRWHRIGRTVSPLLDMHASCHWPLGPEDNNLMTARALQAMVGGYQSLPKDVREFCSAYMGMMLRLRYSTGDTTGPYVINDVDGALDRDGLESWLATVSDEELRRYHAPTPRIRNRRYA